jgi:hypothetical protein
MWSLLGGKAERELAATREDVARLRGEAAAELGQVAAQIDSYHDADWLGQVAAQLEAAKMEAAQLEAPTLSEALNRLLP